MRISHLKSHVVLVIKHTYNSVLNFLRGILFSKTAPKHPRKIYIHRVGQIGDIMCAIPAVSAIRKTYPDAEITMLTSPGQSGNPSAAELLKNLNLIDNLYVYFSNELNSLRKAWMFAKKLKLMDIDLWFQLPQDLTTFKTELRNMLFARLIGARWAYKYCLNTLRFFVKDQARHQKFIRESDLLCQYLEDVGISGCEKKTELRIPQSGDANINKILQDYRLSDAMIMAITPGGKRQSNRWPIERFVEIAWRWIEKKGKVVVLGSSSDEKLGDTIQKKCGLQAVNLCGKTTLLVTAGIFKLSRMLVTNDSGPMHIAAAVGTPCVVAFSARDFPVKWYPYGDRHTIIRKDVKCSPCFKDECSNNNLCLMRVTVDEVWDAVKRTAGIAENILIKDNCYE